jgi:hypothetical protein
MTTTPEKFVMTGNLQTRKATSGGMKKLPKVRIVVRIV